MEKHWEKEKPLFLLFLDIQKAYDSIPREHIWACLKKLKVRDSLIAKVKMLYEKTSSCVQVGCGLSDWFETKRGVQQGSALSPILFIIVMDAIIKNLKEKGQENLHAFAFADDVVIWGDSEKDVEERLQRWNQKFERYGLNINKDKTVVLKVQKGDNEPKIMLNGTKLDSVSEFKYLGSIVSKDNLAKWEVNNRISKAMHFYHQVRQLLWDKQVPLKTKVTLYKSYYTPILTYSLETITLTRRDNSKLQAAEMKFLRTMIQKTRKDKIRNEKIREEVKIEDSILQKIQKSRLKWFGHVNRMSANKTARREYVREIRGRRPVGRPRKKWTDLVKEDVQERGQNWERIVKEEWFMDRQRWKGLVYHTRETGAGQR